MGQFVKIPIAEPWAWQQREVNGLWVDHQTWEYRLAQKPQSSKCYTTVCLRRMQITRIINSNTGLNKSWVLFAEKFRAIRIGKGRCNIQKDRSFTLPGMLALRVFMHKVFKSSWNLYEFGPSIVPFYRCKNTEDFISSVVLQVLVPGPEVSESHGNL